MNTLTQKQATRQNTSYAGHARCDQAICSARNTFQISWCLAASGQVERCDACFEVYPWRILQWKSYQGTSGFKTWTILNLTRRVYRVECKWCGKNTWNYLSGLYNYLLNLMKAQNRAINAVRNLQGHWLRVNAKQSAATGAVRVVYGEGCRAEAKCVEF